MQTPLLLQLLAQLARAGIPLQWLLAGRDSPFITSDSASSEALSPTSVSYKTTEREPIELSAPILTVDIFITRSSKRWVCKDVASLTAASSPTSTRSNSVRYVVASQTRRPIRAPKSRRSGAIHGVPARPPTSTSTARDSYRPVTSSVRLTNRLQSGSTRAR